MKTRLISRAIASRIERNLLARLGQPETSSASDLGHWITEATYRFRRNDGSAWSRLGFGPTRKLVTLSYDDKRETVRLTVARCAN